MAAISPIDDPTTRKIPLYPPSMRMAAIVDQEDYRWLKLFRWTLYGQGDSWYAKARIPALGAEVPMHRLIAEAEPGQLVDHKDGDGLNNRKSNLRIATTAQNRCNSRPARGRRYKGVSWDRRREKYVAKIKDKGRIRTLGHFDREEDAAVAYNEAAKEVHGEFAWLNLEQVAGTPEGLARPRKIGRPNRPWYRTAQDAWYVTHQGRKILLARGRGNEDLAHRAFRKLRSAEAGPWPGTE